LQGTMLAHCSHLLGGHGSKLGLARSSVGGVCEGQHSAIDLASAGRLTGHWAWLPTRHVSARATGSFTSTAWRYTWALASIAACASSGRGRGRRTCRNARPPLPKCVVFDLDGCLWYPDMYMLWGGGAPFTPQPDGTLRDRKGEVVTLHSGVCAVMNELADDPKWKGTTVAVASCCDEPSWGRECLAKFGIGAPGRVLQDVVDMSVCRIHKGNKQNHLRQIASSVGCKLEEMIFFDNEPYNCHDVAAIGVTCVFCPGGVTEDVWRSALAGFPDAGNIIGPIQRQTRR